MQKDIQKIEWIETSKVHEWKENPRDILDAEVISLAEAIKQHGFKSALTVWNKNYVVYKGNKSLRAAKVLGLKKVPVNLTEFENIHAAIAYGLSDNKEGEKTEWNKEQLIKLLSAKEVLKMNPGFSESDIGRLGKKLKEGIKEVDDSIFEKRIIIFFQKSDKDRFLKELESLVKKYSNVTISK
jgi:ParB-like chromosome segregation protein Spo0J